MREVGRVVGGVGAKQRGPGEQEEERNGGGDGKEEARGRLVKVGEGGFGPLNTNQP